MNIKEEFIISALRELFVLYEKVKLTIIYAENFDPKQEIYLGPLNQLRSTLDHIFKAVSHTDDAEYELKEAKDHLVRAGIDAFEILSSNLAIEIVNDLDNFNSQTIQAVFPLYYSAIKPEIISIKERLASLRKNKNNTDSFNLFNDYFDSVQKLLEYNKQVKLAYANLQEYENKNFGHKRNRILDFIKPIVWFLAGLIVAYIIMKILE
jgi:hypothetical protein